MITTTCNQYTARAWFKARKTINLAIVFIGFVLLVFVLQTLMYPLIADVIALAIAYVAFFHILAKRAIAITCPHCKGFIETNTPWKCGNPNCLENNEQVDEFPFVYHCEHCGVEPKAYKCHHNNCGEIIFLSKDKLATLCATLIKPEKKSAPPPPKKDPFVDKISQENETIRETEYKLRKAKLDLELKGVTEKLEPIKLKSIRERLRSGVLSRSELEDEVRCLKAEADKKFANDEPSRLKKYAEIDAEARELL
jgi:hypothetical protein